MFLTEEQKKQLGEIVQKHNLTDIGEKIQTIVEEILGKKKEDEDLDIFLMKEKNIYLDEACEIGLEIFEKIIEPTITEKIVEVDESLLAENIIKEFNLPLAPESGLEQRFQESLDLFADRKISNDLMREFLTKSEKIGGLGLGDYYVGLIMSFIEPKVKEIQNKADEKAREQQKAIEQSKIEIPQAVTNILENSGIILPDENAKKRFENIALSFLKDIRTNLETKIVLKRDTNLGGMGFNEEMADKVMNLMVLEKPKIKQEPGEISKPSRPVLLADNVNSLIKAETKFQILDSKPQTPKEPPLEPPFAPIPIPNQTSALFSTLIKESPVVIPEPEIKIIPIEKVIPATPPEQENKIVITAVEPGLKQSQPLVIEPPIIQTQKTLEIHLPNQSSFIPIPTTNAGESEKIKINTNFADLSKIIPKKNIGLKAEGPIDELRNITLVDWRRWGTPKEAAQRIQDKINLLGEESMVAKAEGIKAWKESEINQFYLNIGAESIDQGKFITEIIRGCQQQGLQVLTEEEFNAVVELNQRLRL